MNLTQMKEEYLSKLATKVSPCFEYIDKTMVANYERIKEGKEIKITLYWMNRSSHFDRDYKDGMIREIEKRYADNWEVIYHAKKDDDFFIFRYKGPPENNTPQENNQDIPINDDEEETKREDILDIRP